MTTGLFNPRINAGPSARTGKRSLQVAVICDFLEENWPSMDLVGDMLIRSLTERHSATIEAVRIRPGMPFRIGSTPGATARFFSRFVRYPRQVRRARHQFDLFHIVDHSYAHLVHELPPERTIVTCHDLDAFRCILEPERESRSFAFRRMTRRILTGLQRAAHVACDTETTRTAILSHHLISGDRLSVAHNGVHPALGPEPDPAADDELSKMLGRSAGKAPELLHVGSTITRKRIDTLLQVFAAVRRHRSDVRLLRIGGPFSAEQKQLARMLGIIDSIDVFPRIEQELLAAAYRRSALLLQTSDAEGFGLPVIESMACGTPVIASDISALREVGGAAALYCGVGEVADFALTALQLLTQRELNAASFRQRRTDSLVRARQFTWDAYASNMVQVYERVREAR